MPTIDAPHQLRMSLLALVLVLVATVVVEVEAAEDDFDFFIFAQNWPVTNCIEWKERSSRNTCNIRKSERTKKNIATFNI